LSSKQSIYTEKLSIATTLKLISSVGITSSEFAGILKSLLVVLILIFSKITPRE
jgi:hypothetical protein